jgi:Tol biopolymer transport system component
MKKLPIVLLLLVALLAGCGNPVPTHLPTEPPTAAPTATAAVISASGVIAFALDAGEQRDIYLVNVDGSGLTAVTDDAGWDNWPSWSPDGTRLAFTCRRPVPADGGGRVELTNINEWEPSWSPDGKHISFASTRDQNPEIYMMDADGSNLVRLTHDPADDWMANWSPDGTQIVFVSKRDGDWEIYIMDVSDGGQVGDGQLTKLTDNDAPDGFPAWSPDGTQIVFMSERDGNKEIYLMDADGSDQRRLTDTDFEESFPHWSPDGQWIVYTFLSTDSSVFSFDLMVMHVESGQQQRVTLDTPANEECPNWKP